MSETIYITRGSDATLQFAFQDGDQVAIAITAPTIIESTGGLDGRCTATLVDGPNGLTSVFIEGTDPLSAGNYYLRLQVTLSGGDTLASKRLQINVE
jgi:hypothetical protein